jgi:hypothetical protein
MYAVFRSAPPKQILVVIGSGIGMCSIEVPSLRTLLTQTGFQLCVCKPYHGVGAVESAIKIESRVISVRVGSHSRVLKKAARRRAIIMRKRLSENWLPCGKESSRWRHY